MEKSTKQLVEEFNTLFHGEILRQLPLAGSGRSRNVLNEWHFDIRYNSLPVLVGHSLVLSQRDSDIIYIQRVPFETQDPDNTHYEGESGTLFFPESGLEAAAGTVRCLMNAFIKFPSNNDFRPRKFAPSKLTTTDEDLAAAVAAEFKRVGAYSGLHSILCKPSSRKVNDMYNLQFARMKGPYGFTDYQNSLFQPPLPMTFRDLRITDHLKDHEDKPPNALSPSERARFLECRRFVEEWVMAETSPESVTMHTLDGQVVQARSIMEERPTPDIKAEADRACVVASLDYGIRARTGFGCTRSRADAYNYLIRVTLSPLADDYRKATAHSALVHWHTNAQEGRMDRRYVLAACHHANAAAQFFRQMAVHEPKQEEKQEKLPASHRVLRFMQTVFPDYVKEYPEMMVLGKDARLAQDLRDEQLVRAGRSLLPQRRFELPPRYVCSAVGCNVKVESVKLLRQCTSIHSLYI